NHKIPFDGYSGMTDVVTIRFVYSLNLGYHLMMHSYFGVFSWEEPGARGGSPLIIMTLAPNTHPFSAFKNCGFDTHSDLPQIC
ncbi:hypothetical protein ACJX0J_018640, partial [Zea mays]